MLLALVITTAACSSDTAALADCTEDTGSLRTIDVDVEPIAPAGSEQALLWVPRCAELDRLQIVVVMHGAGMTPSAWFDEPIGAAPVAERLDRTRVDTALLAPGGADGNQFFIDHTLEPLLAAVEADLGMLPPIVGVGGYSAGGPTVARLAFGPDRIEVDNVMVSAPVWAPQYTDWIEDDLSGTSVDRALLDAGADDGLGRSLTEIEAAVRVGAPDVEVTLERPPGGHSIDYMGSRIDVWLAFLAGVALVDVAAPATE